MNVSEKALLVINTIKNAVSKSLTGVTFVSIKNYTNSNDEVSNVLLNVGIKYESAKAKDIEFLENIKFADHEFKSNATDLELARLELLLAFLKPNENRSNGQIDAYTTIFSGIKIHNQTGVLYIYGYKVNKTVLIKGEYPTVKSSAKTIAKNELRKLLKTGQFGQYALEVGNTINANKETLEL